MAVARGRRRGCHASPRCSCRNRPPACCCAGSPTRPGRPELDRTGRHVATSRWPAQPPAPHQRPDDHRHPVHDHLVATRRSTRRPPEPARQGAADLDDGADTGPFQPCDELGRPGRAVDGVEHPPGSLRRRRGPAGARVTGRSTVTRKRHSGSPLGSSTASGAPVSRPHNVTLFSHGTSGSAARPGRDGRVRGTVLPVAAVRVACVELPSGHVARRPDRSCGRRRGRPQPEGTTSGGGRAQSSATARSAASVTPSRSRPAVLPNHRAASSRRPTVSSASA